jgi:hypothetical protein
VIESCARVDPLKALLAQIMDTLLLSSSSI